MSTPNRNKPIRNPFDDGNLGRLIFSPGVFKNRRKDSESSNSEFRWSLEQQSFMAPAFVDNQHTVEEYHYEKDEKIQLHVKNYFNHQHYIPSPEVYGLNKENLPVNMTPQSLKRKPPSALRTESSTQTNISIPVNCDLDFEALVNKHLNHEKNNDESFFSVTSSVTSRKRTFSLFSSSKDVSQLSNDLRNSSNSSFNTTKECSKFRRLSVNSFNSFTEEPSGPLGEISDGIDVHRELIDISPISSPVLSPISSKPGSSHF